MRKDQLFALLRKAAEHSWHTEFVVIGSQAIHGALPDPDIDVVALSPDADTYPVKVLQPATYEEILLNLGQDSDYHRETGTYIEPVSETLARFPDGWMARAISESAGTVDVRGVPTEVTVIFPEIHDLTTSKQQFFAKRIVNFSEAS